MLFCRKCGSIMGDEDHICLNCGTEVGRENTPDLKKDLIDRLTEYRTLLSDNEELETMIKPQKNFPSSVTTFKKKTFWRYFWPYVLGAGLSFLVVYLVIIIITAYTRLNSYNPYTSSVSAKTFETQMMGDVYVGYFTALIVAVALIVIGIKVSKAKQRTFNQGAERMAAEVNERYKKGLLNQKMIELHTDNERKLRLFGDFVPEDYRTASQVASIIALIKDDKASTVEEACALL